MNLRVASSKQAKREATAVKWENDAMDARRDSNSSGSNEMWFEKTFLAKVQVRQTQLLG